MNILKSWSKRNWIFMKKKVAFYIPLQNEGCHLVYSLILITVKDCIITAWPNDKYLQNDPLERALEEKEYVWRNIQLSSFDDLSHEDLNLFFCQFVIWSCNSLKQISSWQENLNQTFANNPTLIQFVHTTTLCTHNWTETFKLLNKEEVMRFVISWFASVWKLLFW